MNAYVYILHFEKPLAHAQHYAGSTAKLRQRLTAHANGAGSALCRALMREGIEWRLGGLGACSHAAMRRLERSLKNQHNAARYCTICNPETKRIKDTTPYPLEAIPFPICSNALRIATNAIWKPKNITTRFTSPDEPKTTVKRILDLMKADKDALGFIPCGGNEGIQSIHDKGLVCIVSNNGEDVGYTAFTISHDASTLNIHQCVVSDDARLLGHGKAMVDAIAEKFPFLRLCAKVRNDLTANEFWLAMDFVKINERIHKTSGSTINQYHKRSILQRIESNEARPDEYPY